MDEIFICFTCLFAGLFVSLFSCYFSGYNFLLLLIYLPLCLFYQLSCFFSFPSTGMNYFVPCLMQNNRKSPLISTFSDEVSVPFRLVTLVKRSRYSRDVLNEKNELNFYKTNTIYDLMWISFQLSQYINAGITFYLTNRFQVAIPSVTHSAAPRVPLFLFSPHFDVLCDLLLNRRKATWNLFVLYNKELKCTEKKF